MTLEQFVENYNSKEIVAWMHYDSNWRHNSTGEPTKKFSLYPRFIREEFSTLVPIEQNIEIDVRTTGSEYAENVYSRYGKLVIFSIKASLELQSFRIPDKPFLRYNASYGKFESEVWIEQFPDKEYYQIISCDMSVEALIRKRHISKNNEEIYTKHILLKRGDKLYGPFEYSDKESTYGLIGIKDYDYQIGINEFDHCTQHIYHVDSIWRKNPVDFIPTSYIKVPSDCIEKIDWVSDKKLVDILIQVLADKRAYSNVELGKLEDALAFITSDSAPIPLSESRIKRLQQLVSNGTIQKRENLIELFLSDPSIKSSFATEIIEKYPRYIEDCLLESRIVQDAIEKRVEQIKSQSPSSQNGNNDDGLQELFDALQEENDKQKEEIVNLKAINSSINQEVELLREKNDYIAERLQVYDDLEKEISDAREKKKVAQAEYNQWQQGIEDAKKQFATYRNEAQLALMAVDTKMITNFLSACEDVKQTEAKKIYHSPLIHDFMPAKAIIERVQNFIQREAKRSVSFNDTANYLICVTQGFITTFAGEPGSGKTSLCNLIAKALGLATGSDNKRYVDISVERGWTSHKDFIGYYNPLTKSMEKSNAEVFDAFERLSTEQTLDDNLHAPFIILLDEANLSPIEHYWAAFLRNCDYTDQENRSISIGGEMIFKLPKHLRFLATVNFDHTTEELSPRFLDRSWIIYLKPERIDGKTHGVIHNYEDMVSFEAMKSAFMRNDEDEMDEVLSEKWDRIKLIFRNHNLAIMPRNVLMVTNYCIVANKCMECGTPLTKYAPLDYAVAQKILPTINGSGNDYKSLIDELLSECTEQSMPISAEHLNRIKRIGNKNMDYYQFFAR